MSISDHTAVSIIRRAITVETYSIYPQYATLDDEMIAKLLHLLTEQNTLCT